MPNTPCRAAAAISQGRLAQPSQARLAKPASSSARAASACSITRRGDARSTQGPSHSALKAPAATSASSRPAICQGVACRLKVASQGMASRLSMLPKFDSPSAASSRETSPGFIGPF